jgi:biopolymer transport protein ExbD
MVTSTLVNPNALKLLLPKSSNQTQTARNITVSVKRNLTYYINRKPVRKENLRNELQKLCFKETKPSISLYADQEIATKHVVEIMDMVKDLKSKEGKANCKLILATRGR